jgi:hypothetical protein
MLPAAEDVVTGGLRARARTDEVLRRAGVFDLKDMYDRQVKA